MLHIEIVYTEDTMYGSEKTKLPTTQSLSSFCEEILTQPSMLLIRDKSGQSRSVPFSRIESLVINNKRVFEISLFGINAVIFNARKQ
jgi:hypothetical protein